MRYKIVLLFITLICCEFSDESLQGPPERNNKKNDEYTEEETSKKEEFVGSVEDEDGATTIRIESAPDLSNERDHHKSKLHFYRSINRGKHLKYSRYPHLFVSHLDSVSLFILILYINNNIQVYTN